MSTDSIREADPFADPRHTVAEERDLIAESTLDIGRNASLTLGTDSLIVLDEGLQEAGKSHCCGLVPTTTTHTRSIPFYNILWASLTKVDLTIHYAKPASSSPKSSVAVAYVSYTLDSSSTAAFTKASAWTTRLLDRAYGSSQRKKRIKIVINPYGGVGKAVKLYNEQIAPIFAAAGCVTDVERTAYSRHATEIAEKLDVDSFDVVAAASGDGVVYEIFNGLAKKQRATEALHKIAVVQLPCGSGNAMSWNLNGTDDPSLAALCIVKGLRTSFDLASVTQGHERTISFLTQALGVVADSDLGTENIRWMGDARFTYGILSRLWGKTMYPCDIAVKTEIEDKDDIKKHYATEVARTRLHKPQLQSLAPDRTAERLPELKYGRVTDPVPSDWSPLSFYPNLGNFYAGNVCVVTEDTPFFPASLPHDGMMDLVTIDGDMPRKKGLSLLLQIPKGTFFDDEVVRVRKVVAYRCVPRFGKWADKHAPSAGRKGKLGLIMEQLGVTRASSSKADDWDGGYISIDGEKVPFEPFQVEVHKGLGTVLSKSGCIYETAGPTGWEAFLPAAKGETTHL